MTEIPSKKVKKDAIKELFLKKALSDKEQHEKRLKINASAMEHTEKSGKPVDRESSDKHVKVESEGTYLSFHMQFLEALLRYG